jgi:YD repeat-containing protein
VFPDATPGVPADNDRYVYGYDAAGRVRRTVTPNGAVVTQEFDALGRLEQRSLPDHEYRFTYTPDSLPANSQHTDTVRDETWSVAYAYDSRRLPVSATETHPGLPARTFAYTHDAAGRRDSAALASGRTESFALDAQGRMTGVSTVFATTAGDRAVSAAFVYDAAGRQTAKSYAGGAMARSYAYDGRNRLLAVAGTRAADGFNLLSHEYRYRESGNRSYAKRGWDVAGGGSVCTADLYEYDALYRVVDTKYGVAATPTAGTVGPANQPAAIDFATATAAFRQELKLDLLANRVQFAQTGTDPSALAYGGYDGTAATSYTPDPRCRTASVDDGSGTVSPVWDANGALTDDGVRLYEYDPENRLLGVSPKSPAAGDLRAEYAYDALGRRARRIVEEFDGAAWGPLSETHYFHDGWSVVEEVDGGGKVGRMKYEV